MLKSLIRPLTLASAAAFVLTAGSAAAQSDPTAAEPPLCTDRPTKSGNTCTVPAGDVQIEADVVNWSRGSADGVTTKTILLPNPTVKYGVLPNLDVELNWAPLERVTTVVNGRTITYMGTGDLYLRTKWAAISGDAFSLSIIPYVKAPTASDGIGDDHVEGGLVARMKFGLPAGFNLIVAPEVDALENLDRDGVHPNMINVVNLNRSFGRWTVLGEIWSQQNFDPTRTIVQTTADTAVAYLVTKTFQIDVGANFGLTRDAPQQQYSIGISKRF